MCQMSMIFFPSFTVLEIYVYIVVTFCGFFIRCDFFLNIGKHPLNQQWTINVTKAQQNGAGCFVGCIVYSVLPSDFKYNTLLSRQ